MPRAHRQIRVFAKPACHIEIRDFAGPAAPYKQSPQHRGVTLGGAKAAKTAKDICHYGPLALNVWAPPRTSGSSTSEQTVAHHEKGFDAEVLSAD
jgi:hypothetical protein